jgi:quinol monooxygenase YgiN
MARQTVSVTARIRAKAGKEDEARAALLTLVDKTSAEKGCINYDLHQSEEEAGLFLIYENWLSRDDLADHLRTPHLQAFRAQAQELLAEPVQTSLWKIL